MTSQPCPPGPVTKQEAEKFCRDRQKQLCNNGLDEVNYCCGTGCEYDSQWIWVGDRGITFIISFDAYKIINSFIGKYF